MIFGSVGTETNLNDLEPTMESTQYINEMIMIEGLNEEELEEFLEDGEEVEEAITSGFLQERTIVRLDKKAKLSKARKMAIFTIAKEKNDPKFKKLVKVWKMERFLEAFLEKKYGNEAMRRAKKSVASAKKSKSGIINKAAEKAKASLNTK